MLIVAQICSVVGIAWYMQLNFHSVKQEETKSSKTPRNKQYLSVIIVIKRLTFNNIHKEL